MIKTYYNHLYRNMNSLLVKTVNIYKLEVYLGNKFRKLYVLVMKNLFSDIKKPDLVFDLKGSTHGRKSKIPEGKKHASVYKDLDWLAQNQNLQIEKMIKTQILQQLREDSIYLRKCRVMDYSLLIGITEVQPKHLEAIERDKTGNKYENGSKKPIHKVSQNISFLTHLDGSWRHVI